MSHGPERVNGRCDYLIVGGGLVGCSLAVELARAGAQVAVVERGRIGGEASSAGAGLLSPTFFEPTTQGPLIDLCRQSATSYEDWIKELYAAGADQVHYRRTGLLTVALDEAEAAHLQSTLADDNYPGRRAYWLSAAELRRKEPALADHVRGAAFYPDDAHVDPARLVRQVARVAERLGVAIYEDEPVVRLEERHECVVAVQTIHRRFQPGTVVLTAGAWTGLFGEQVGRDFPTHPVKGHLLMADCRTPPVRTPLHTGNGLLIPWADGRLLLGVTLDGNTFDTRVQLGSVRQILERTMALVPAVAQLSLERIWTGLRPATPDEWPYLGPVGGLRNLWLSAGHFRKGILLAPICARLLARSLREGTLAPELRPFSPDRRQRVTAAAR